MVCVVADMRTMLNSLRPGVACTANDPPTRATPGPASITGRGAGEPFAANRYGGEYTSAFQWSAPHRPVRFGSGAVQVAPASPPPPEKTRPSVMSTAVEWYARAWFCAFRSVQALVAGFQTSAFLTAKSSVN